MRTRLVVLCVLAIAACGRNDLAAPAGARAMPASTDAQPATLHVVPLHDFTLGESFIGNSGGSAGLVGDPSTGLFGVAPAGGDLKCQDGNKGCGFIYELVPQSTGNSYQEKRLYEFHGKSGQDGAQPSATLFIGERGTGVLYGTTVYGGEQGKGTVFRITPTVTPYVYKERVLYSFGATRGDGQYPYASLIEIQRVLYGTTSAGGAHNEGIAFSLSVTGTAPQKLHDFGGGNDGATPYAGLSDVNGTLYGTTNAGGSSNCGTVFSLGTSGSERVVYSFLGSPNDGCNPGGSGVVELGGVLYGTTSAGGKHNNCHCGTIYSLNESGIENVLHSFPGGGDPVASLIAANGVLYGTALYGGAKCSVSTKQGCGIVFSLAPPAQYQVQFTFTGTRAGGGAAPAAPLLASGADFYGTSSRGSTRDHGEAFKLEQSLLTRK